MIRYINLTPHAINYHPYGGQKTVIQPDRLREARLETRTETISGTETLIVGGARELPPYQEGIRYIVSLPYAMAVQRDDLVVPHDQERDGQGRVTGCRRLLPVQVI